jgi:glutathione reductase (NADPH)
VSVNGETVTADHVLVAVGGSPRVPDIPGKEHVITSDGFFELEKQPKHVVVVGGGYVQHAPAEVACFSSLFKYPQ